MDTVKDHEFYEGLAKAIETYMKYRSPGHNDPFVLRMSKSCAEGLQRLLEKQEPKPVKVTKNVYNYQFYNCPNCGRGFELKDYKKLAYCDKCGQAVKWDDGINLS